jgi:hypothetical protein
MFISLLASKISGQIPKHHDIANNSPNGFGG